MSVCIQLKFVEKQQKKQKKNNNFQMFTNIFVFLF